MYIVYSVRTLPERILFFYNQFTVILSSLQSAGRERERARWTQRERWKARGKYNGERDRGRERNR